MFQFVIATPERVIYDKKISQVTMPTTEGEITILENHIPLISILKAGELIIRSESGEEAMAISGGMVQVGSGKVTVLADTAEKAEEIDEKRAEEARERAKKMLEEKHADDKEYAIIMSKIDKEMARLKVARKKKYKDVK